MSVVTTAAPGPTEKRITTGIRYANAGTICIASSTGVIALLKRHERPASTPTGRPTSSESPTAANTSENVSTDSSHSPSSAKLANAASTPSAARRPPKRSTTSVPSTTVPAQVSLWKKLMNHATSWSRKFEKPLKILNAMFGSGTLRLLLSQTWKWSRCGTSEFHVSHAGHG